MSLRKHKDIKLEGFVYERIKYEGFTQIFPKKALRVLNNFQRRSTFYHYNHSTLLRIQNTNIGIIGNPTTSDGYKWYAGVLYKKRAGSIVVLFPYTQDCAEKNKSKADRSAAIFVTGRVDERIVNGLTSLLVWKIIRVNMKCFNK